MTRALRLCAEHLRARVWPHPLFADLVARCVALAGHESARPRQAVAEALPYLPDDVYAALLPKLEKDPSLYVRDAVAAAPAKRATRKREEAQAEEEDARVALVREALAGRPPRRRLDRGAPDGVLRPPGAPRGEKPLPSDRGLAPQARRDHQQEPRGRAPPRLLRADAPDPRQRARERARPRARLPLSQPSLDLAPLAEDLAAHFADRRARLDVDLSGVDGRIELVADAGRLRQAFANILRNAVEAYDGMPGDPRIRIAVSARVSGTDALVVFKDQGAGMNDEQRARAFVPFGSKKPGGTGFGLYNARKVARQIHGGHLAIESAAGEGTRGGRGCR